jgi:nucleoside-diphosphate-sugar epimerase
MKIVVTGAAGFIGSNLVKGLNARGIDDIIACRLPTMSTLMIFMICSPKVPSAQLRPSFMRARAATPWSSTAST